MRFGRSWTNLWVAKDLEIQLVAVKALVDPSLGREPTPIVRRACDDRHFGRKMDIRCGREHDGRLLRQRSLGSPNVPSVMQQSAHSPSCEPLRRSHRQLCPLGQAPRFQHEKMAAEISCLASSRAMADCAGITRRLIAFSRSKPIKNSERNHLEARSKRWTQKEIPISGCVLRKTTRLQCIVLGVGLLTGPFTGIAGGRESSYRIWCAHLFQRQFSWRMRSKRGRETHTRKAIGPRLCKVLALLRRRLSQAGQRKPCGSSRPCG